MCGHGRRDIQYYRGFQVCPRLRKSAAEGRATFCLLDGQGLVRIVRTAPYLTEQMQG